jgi:hypothetical protein
VTDDPAIRPRHESVPPQVIGGHEHLSLLVADSLTCTMEPRRTAVDREVGIEALQIGQVIGNDTANTDVIASHIQMLPVATDPAECRVSRGGVPWGTHA